MKHKHVSIREFQQNLYKNLPISQDDVTVVTKHGQQMYAIMNVSQPTASVINEAALKNISSTISSHNHKKEGGENEKDNS